MKKEYNNFYFEKFEFDEKTLVADFYYSFDKELEFKETINFSCENFTIRNDLNIEIIKNILFHIHLALWISYYKFYLTKDLIVESWKLDENQINFWKKFYINWLWEFFFRNNIDISELLNFKNSPNSKKYEKIDFEVNDKYLVPVGWWKDSIVSIELLKKFWKKIDLVTFAVNDNILYENTAQISWLKRLFIKRKLSENIMEVVNSWAYNWHVPITWIIAFVLELASYIYDYKFIVLSNEFSANFWNTFWQGIEVNHQWSKSLDFEKTFGDYVSRYISNDVKYFSLLRPFYELKIAELFTKYWKKYFEKFSSCNVNFKVFKKESIEIKNQSFWCLECPKCAFVYTILRPFLSKEETLKIFSRELFEDEKLEQLFRELAWISWIKPFECVWTNEEVVLAMKMSLKNWQWELPYILKIFSNEIDSNMTEKDYKKLEEKILNWHFLENLICEDLIEMLKKE